MNKAIASSKDITKNNNGPNTKMANAKMIDCAMRGSGTSGSLFSMVRLLGPILDYPKSKKIILSQLDQIDQARISFITFNRKLFLLKKKLCIVIQSKLNHSSSY